MTLLLLAGTAEARALAAGLAGAGVPAIASLAGATRDPPPLALPTRVGGFGGREGFEAFLDAARIAAVLDATHPFAAAITARTAEVCAARGLPVLRLARPPYSRSPGWRAVAAPRDAAQALPQGATALLATGRGSLLAFGGCPATLWLRVVDPPDRPFPLRGGWIVARPPFDRASEEALLRRLGATHVVAKDAGGEGRAKLDAADGLGLAVVLIDRPPDPPGLRTVATVADALDWARALPLRSGP